MERSTALPADSRHVCFSSMVVLSVGRSMIDVFDSLVLVVFFFSETLVATWWAGWMDVNEQNGKWRDTDADSNLPFVNKYYKLKYV
jgi:hypothetical protein